ncbi:MAG TPA: malto-oligosyltrehalose synthase [Cellvibrionaceae bacterium]
MPAVSATVRLQFHRDFPLDAAIPLVAYFNQLGISHIYASPLLKARSGSMHGYDVVDPSCVNPDVGGEAALQRLVAELRKYRMGLIVDMVCNHMAVGASDNPWWQDVLTWGINSAYARFFDIQWNSPDPLLKGQLLLPFLRSDYGEVLAAGEITLEFDSVRGAFYVQHADHQCPLYPPSYGQVLRAAQQEALRALAEQFDALEVDPNCKQKAADLQQQLRVAAAQPAIAEAIAQALRNFEPKPLEFSAVEAPGNQDADAVASDLHPDWLSNEPLQRLHQLLEAQHFRLASWRTAADDINWRRFFDVNELGGLRVERPEVFAATHAKIFQLIEQGLIDGLRIDHVDGLARPRGYCRKLRRTVTALAAQRPGELAQDYIPLYVEKILASREALATDWQVDGTTGYEFMNEVSLLQHDPQGELVLGQLWRDTSGRLGSFDEEAREARRLVLTSSLAGDVEMVAQGLLTIARADIATRDLTLGAIRRALVELVVNFPVYRTYSGVCGRSEQDEAVFAQAMAGARSTLVETDWPLLEYLERWLGGQVLHQLPPNPTRALRRRVLARFQQLTSPAAAKAVEDTACYRSAVLLSRNDVGFDPQCFSAPMTEFHARCVERSGKFPANMLTTATHDHKRGEDTRARLAVISERAGWWAEKIQYWQNLAQPLRAQFAEGPAPSAGDELILYQNLVGSWPLTLKLDDEQGLTLFLERLHRWQEKALREAKLRTSWGAPNGDYEAACKDFLTRLISGDDTFRLRRDIAAAAQSLAAAGALNSLTQCLLRMTAPGVPDLYQGGEFWDFSFVDPDNRQPVDFPARIDALLAHTHPQELLKNWRDGCIKQWLIAQTLRARRAHSELFLAGDYQPLSVTGDEANSVVAFARAHGSELVIVIAPRLTAHLLNDSPDPHIPAAAWGDTRVILPATIRNRHFESALNALQFEASDNRLFLREVLADLPVNILFSATLSKET